MWPTYRTFIGSFFFLKNDIKRPVAFDFDQVKWKTTFFFTARKSKVWFWVFVTVKHWISLLKDIRFKLLYIIHVKEITLLFKNKWHRGTTVLIKKNWHIILFQSIYFVLKAQKKDELFQMSHKFWLLILLSAFLTWKD